ncbi:MAG: hypothetical protein M1820_008872 [Bogoriella megaspora]|nr:MAG: hypothetical protein M1820_008872 [Bogoriella megaspora]
MKLFQLLSILLTSVLQVSVSKIIYAGVNESGGEFGSGTLPGTFGIDYQFINETHVQYFIDRGVNERMCLLEYGLGRRFNETYYSLYQDAVDFITERGSYALIDPHNYMRYNDPSMQPNSGSVIGNTSDPNAATTEQFGEFWNELASRLRYNPNVIFGLMNEPHNMSTELILKDDQAAVDGIRNASASQFILVPGNGYTNAEIWTNTSGNGLSPGSTPNSEVLGNISDPFNNFAFDMHLYLDYDFSGTHNSCVSTDFGAQNLVLATQWLEQNNFTAFLSEVGAGANQVCYQALNNTIAWLESHPVFFGWSYWAAGPLWGDYFLSIEPYEGPEFNTTWPLILEPRIDSYQPIKRFGISSRYESETVVDVGNATGTSS